MADLEQGVEIVSENDVSGDPQIAAMIAADEAAEADTSVVFENLVLEDDSDVESLLPKFKNVAALTKSYTELERRLGQMTERAREADELERVLYDTQQTDAMAREFEQAAESEDWRSQLALTAARAAAEARSQLGWETPAPQPPDVRESLSVAYEAVANAVGPEQWQQVAPVLDQYIQANPAIMQPAVQSGDAGRIAAALMDATRTAVAADQMRSVKLAQIGLPGAGGRPPVRSQQDTDWSEIANAAAREPGRYW